MQQNQNATFELFEILTSNKSHLKYLINVIESKVFPTNEHIERQLRSFFSEKNDK